MRITVMRLKSQVSNSSNFHQGFDESLKQNMMDDIFIDGFYKKLASNGNIDTIWQEIHPPEKRIVVTAIKNIMKFYFNFNHQLYKLVSYNWITTPGRNSML